MYKSTSKNDSIRKNTVKAATDTKSILNVTNPEIFITSPRSGGFLKIMVPSKSQDFIATGGPSETDNMEKSRISTMSSYSSRTCRYCPDESQSTLRDHFFENDPDMDFDEMEQLAEDNLDAKKKETVGMLAVTISTVMLMASENPIPQEHLEWAETYLSNIMDEKGQHPINVESILNHIKKLRRRGEYTTTSDGIVTCNCTL